MKTILFKKSISIQSPIRILLLITVFSIFLTDNLLAKTAKEIDASVDVAIERFYKQVKGAKDLAKASKGTGR